MKAIITGMNGTLAPYVYKELIRHNIEVIIWDRNKTEIRSEESVYRFIRDNRPDFFFHIATGPVAWLEHIARATQAIGVKLLFTSSVSVFSEQGSGPYDIASVPNAEDEYGRYKIQCEQAVRTHHPEAVIIRLGWQIGDSIGTNNMFDFLSSQQAKNGFIEASTRWFPSCSFLTDTAEAIVSLALAQTAGTYLANSNRKYSFYEIVSHLKDKYQTDWIIRASMAFVRDDRMTDERVAIHGLY